MNNILPIITNQPLDVLIGALVGYFASIYKSKNTTNASLSKTYADAIAIEIKQMQSDINVYRDRINTLQKINENLASQNNKLIQQIKDLQNKK
ncbi:MAG: hypothetical protein ACRC69_08560 [Acinetobacter baumannii]